MGEMGCINTHFFFAFKKKEETVRLVLKKKEGKNKSDSRKSGENTVKM